MHSHLPEYDVVIVGARCSGAALGAFLAERGVRTLILDSDALPSDMKMSTHFMQPRGLDVLDELGVGNVARDMAPPIKRQALVADSYKVVTRYPHDRSGRGTRRFKTDALLQAAASAAGAEIRDRHKVVDLIRDGERVVGVVVRTPQGHERIYCD